MEEPFGLTWEDTAAVVQAEEVICGIENEILPGDAEEFTGVTEEVVQDIPQNGEEVQVDNGIMYLTDGNVLVMQPGEPDGTYQEYMQVTEEVVTDQWGKRRVLTYIKQIVTHFVVRQAKVVTRKSSSDRKRPSAAQKNRRRKIATSRYRIRMSTRRHDRIRATFAAAGFARRRT